MTSSSSSSNSSDIRRKRQRQRPPPLLLEQEQQRGGSITIIIMHHHHQQQDARRFVLRRPLDHDDHALSSSNSDAMIIRRKMSSIRGTPMSHDGCCCGKNGSDSQQLQHLLLLDSDAPTEADDDNNKAQRQTRDRQIPRHRKKRLHRRPSTSITGGAWSLSLNSLLLLVVLLLHNTPNCYAAVPCDPTTHNATDMCASVLRPGSECSPDGFCTNPFQQGCLRNYFGPATFSDRRTCNSDDTTLDNCTPSPLQYSEIRILAQNWETPMLTAWILQIVLSELMQVPATLELSGPHRDLNFYSPTNAFDYGAIGYDWQALQNANHQIQYHGKNTGNATQLSTNNNINIPGDCPQEWRTRPSTEQEQTTNWEYKACAHVMCEVWSGQQPKVANLTLEGVVEPPEGTGVVAKLGWFLPKFLAQQDPSLTHWLGLTGEQNRRRVAETFNVPTTFGYYCANIVPHNCSVPTLFAARPPRDETEAAKYYIEGGVFQGYFRYTPENDCDLNPTTCVGHITDVPCEWTTFAIPQAYHLNISVVSRGPLAPNHGYAYDDLLDIWAAANATQSAVLMYWWYPDPTYQLYLGTAAEMQAVQLPPPRQECVTHRVTPEQKCSDTPLEDRVGDPRGSCDSEAHSLLKLVVANLYPSLNGAFLSSSNNQEMDSTSSGNHSSEDSPSSSTSQQAQSDKWNPALKSPAYEAIQALSITELQLGEIIDAWESRGLDKWNYDPREAVCEWVVNNLQTLQTWIPRTYPRIVQTDAYNHGHEVLFGFAQGIGCFVSVLVFGTAILTYWWRKRPLLVFAQVGFLYFLLLGLFFVSVGSVLVAVEPTDASCTMQHWFIMLGYTLELVPLIVKVAAIHRMMQAARKMRRVTLQHRQLYGTVFLFVVMATILLAIWTAVDPSERRDQITLHPDRVTEKGETVVTVTHFCASEHNDDLWRYLTLAWQLVLLLCATVLAVQTRKTRRDLNESSALGILIYSHFFFVILRCITFVLEGSGEEGNETVERSTLEALRSLIFSSDAFVALNLYFTPKMYSLFKYDDEHFKAVMSLQRRSSVVSKMNMYPRGSQINSSFNGSQILNAGSLHDPDQADSDGTRRRRSSHISLAQLEGISDNDKSSGELGSIAESKTDHDENGNNVHHNAKPDVSGGTEENQTNSTDTVKAALPMSSIESSCVSISSDEDEGGDEESYLGENGDRKEKARPKSDDELHANQVDSVMSALRNLRDEATTTKEEARPCAADPALLLNGTIGDAIQEDLASASSEHKCSDDDINGR